MRLSYAIVFVGDMARSVAFYRDTLGLPLRFESPHWSELVTGEATLALHASPHGVAGNDPRNLPAGCCRPGLAVPDLDAFHRRMLEQQVPCIQEPQDQFGTRIAQYLDPDGLGISVSEERSPAS